MLLKSKQFPILMGLIMLSPMAIDIYIASLPDIVAYFKVSQTQGQLTISLYLLCLGMAQILVGPLTDQFGRRPVALTGIFIYCCCALVISITDNFTWVLIARAFQGMAACGATIVAFSTARDLYSGEQINQAMSYLSGAIAIVPSLAPAIGGVIASYFGWQYDFVFMSIFASAIFFWFYYGLNETCPSIGQQKKIYSIQRYKPILSHKNFIFYSMIGLASMLNIISYITYAPLWMLEGLNMTQAIFITVFSMNAFLNMIACFTTPILLKVTNRRNLIITGLCLQLCAGCLFIVDYQTWEKSYIGFIIPSLLFVISLAWTMSPSAAIGLTPFGKQAGTASALFNFIQVSGASLIIVIVSQLSIHPVYMCGGLLASSSGLLLMCFKSHKLQSWHQIASTT
tara:strand:+ start:3292 stop:4485 length:1194 start_codon:yes stop_codon:yes gene_type:complete